MHNKIYLQYTTFTAPLPDFIYEGLKEYSRNANGYKPQPIELIKKLSDKYNLPQEMIFLTAGADEAINIFASAYGKQTYFFTPTYIVYSETKNFDAHITSINALKNNDYSVPTDCIPDATLIYLANPNNPVGYTPKNAVLQLVKNNPQAIVVVDEVYAEFADESVINEVVHFPNLAVIRSFSKSYCLAANRIGFIAAHQNIISLVRTKTQWANVSYLSTGAAVVALGHEEYFKKIRNDLIGRREKFVLFLKSKRFTVMPTKINAVLIKFDSDKEGTRFATYLTENNFVISHGNGNSNVGLDESFVRIAIGEEAEMEMLSQTITMYK